MSARARAGRRPTDPLICHDPGMPDPVSWLLTRPGGGMAAGLAAEARRLEGDALHPIQLHEQPMNVWRRMYLAVRRLIGR